MIKMLMPMSTPECVAHSSGVAGGSVERHSAPIASVQGTRLPVGGWFSGRGRTQQVFAGSTGVVSFLRTPVLKPAYNDLSAQLVPTDPRTAVSNGTPGLRTWSPPV
jgi:hypothetical protein